jgi:hypothetical protein
VRIMRCAIVVSAIFLAGCGNSEEPVKVDLTTTPQPSEGAGMLGDQMKTAKMKGNPTAKTAAPAGSATK